MWETSFEAINRYNTVYAGIEGAVAAGVITEEKGNQYKGECLFLRALTYHNLMIHYALPYNVEGNNNYGMPIYTKAVNDPSQLAEQAVNTGSENRAVPNATTEMFLYNFLYNIIVTFLSL